VILFFIATSFLAGVVLAAIGGAEAWPMLLLGGVGVALGALLAGRRSRALGMSLILLAGLAGSDRYEEARPPESPAAWRSSTTATSRLCCEES
jgi:hypothetical protein